jgi:hypothetical protein
MPPFIKHMFVIFDIVGYITFNMGGYVTQLRHIYEPFIDITYGYRWFVTYLCGVYEGFIRCMPFFILMYFTLILPCKTHSHLQQRPGE